MADGTLTPAVTVTTAIEGLKGLNFGGNVPVSTQNMVIAITVVILLVLFSIQKMGTSIIGKAFGPIMFLWFTFLGVMGVMNMAGDWSILQAINPIYAIRLLVSPYNKAGLFILGSSSWLLLVLRPYIQMLVTLVKAILLVLGHLFLFACHSTTLVKAFGF